MDVAPEAEGVSMSNSATDGLERLEFAIGDDVVSSFTIRNTEIKFSPDFHLAWKGAVKDAVRRMQSEQRITDDDVEVAHTVAANILSGAVKHARHSGRGEIVGSDIHAGISHMSVMGVWPFSLTEPGSSHGPE